MSLKPAKFRVSKKPTAKASKRKKRARAGTRIRFTLNTKATVTIRIDQKLKGIVVFRTLFFSPVAKAVSFTR